MRRVLLLCVLAGSAAADPGPHREGEYGGVAPGRQPDAPGAQGSQEAPRRPGKAGRPTKGMLGWIGFEPKDGGAQVFFQSAAPFEVKQHLEGATLVVHLSLVRLAHNTGRRLDTRFFDNPLAVIDAGIVGARRATKTRPARGPGIDVRITFKDPKDAREGTLRTATEADGLFYAYLAFPAGTAAAAPSKLPDPEP